MCVFCYGYFVIGMAAAQIIQLLLSFTQMMTNLQYLGT
jgi:hypothetical protein